MSVIGRTLAVGRAGLTTVKVLWVVRGRDGHCRGREEETREREERRGEGRKEVIYDWGRGKGEGRGGEREGEEGGKGGRE